MDPDDTFYALQHVEVLLATIGVDLNLMYRMIIYSCFPFGDLLASAV